MARFAAAAVLTIGVAGTRSVRAEDGGNDVCPASAVEADDIRERYDARQRLVHQLRLSRGRVVLEAAIAYHRDHAVARTEVTPGHVRVARNYFRDDRVSAAECYLDGTRVGYASYRYDDDGHLLLFEKYTLVGEQPTPSSAAPAARAWVRETTRHGYDLDGQLVETEVRGADNRRISLTRTDRAALAVPIVLSLTAGGAYQSDTQLYDLTAGLGIHREPKYLRWGADPLEVGLEGMYRFHRAAGITSMDQTSLRLFADYHDIVPRITLFTFTATERNLPTNLRLNLEEAVLGVKLDVLRARHYAFDVSFAPIWNYRSILNPSPDGDASETTSKLRGSLRARASLRSTGWSLVDTFEFLPTLFGDDVDAEDDFWNRTVVRNTVAFEVNLTPYLTLSEVFKYTWDPAMRAQATCPDEQNPLCLGYSFSSTTALRLSLTL